MDQLRQGSLNALPAIKKKTISKGTISRDYEQYTSTLPYRVGTKSEYE